MEMPALNPAIAKMLLQMLPKGMLETMEQTAHGIKAGVDEIHASLKRIEAQNDAILRALNSPHIPGDFPTTNGKGIDHG